MGIFEYRSSGSTNSNNPNDNNSNIGDEHHLSSGNLAANQIPVQNNQHLQNVAPSSASNGSNNSSSSSNNNKNNNNSNNNSSVGTNPENSITFQTGTNRGEFQQHHHGRRRRVVTAARWRRGRRRDDHDDDHDHTQHRKWQQEQRVGMGAPDGMGAPYGMIMQQQQQQPRQGGGNGNDRGVHDGGAGDGHVGDDDDDDDDGRNDLALLRLDEDVEEELRRVPIPPTIPRAMSMPRTQIPLLQSTWERDWPSVLQRVKTDVHEAFYVTNGSKRTALHLASFNQGCPLAVARALLAANPHALVTLDSQGYTPLHYACSFSNANNDLVVLYCRYLQRIYKVLNRQAHPPPLAPTDDPSPLLLACKRQAPLKVLQVLMATAASSSSSSSSSASMTKTPTNPFARTTPGGGFGGGGRAGGVPLSLAKLLLPPRRVLTLVWIAPMTGAELYWSKPAAMRRRLDDDFLWPLRALLMGTHHHDDDDADANADADGQNEEGEAEAQQRRTNNSAHVSSSKSAILRAINSDPERNVPRYRRLTDRLTQRRNGATSEEDDDETSLTSEEALWQKIVWLVFRSSTCSMMEAQDIMMVLHGGDSGTAMRQTPPPLPPFLLLHVLVCMQHPEVTLVECAVRLFPDQAAQQDAMGMLPLHHAICHSNLQGRDCKRILSALLQINPAAAMFGVNAYHHDEFHKLQRQLLLQQQGHGGKDKRGGRHQDDNCLRNPPRKAKIMPLVMALYHDRDWMTGGLQELVHAAPDVLVQRDDTTQLFPFQVAASRHATLTTLYGLISAAPQQVALATDNTTSTSTDGRTMTEVGATAEASTQEQWA